MQKKPLVVCGIEDEQGRALFVVSALYHCVDALKDRPVRFVGVQSAAVEIAVGVLRFDTGLRTEIVPDAAQDACVRHAGLYAAVAMDDATTALALLGAAHHVPRLVLLQFPPYERMAPHTVPMLAAAHDHRRFAALLCSRLR